MLDRLATFIVGEGNWLPLAMGAGFIASGWLLYSLRGAGTSQRQVILGAMNLFSGVMLLIMGFGHLLAVTTKLLIGTLVRGSPVLFYAIGLVVVVPAWLVVRQTRKIVTHGEMRSTMWVNLGMAVALLVLGPVNLPLAIPNFCNAAYSVHKHPAIGWSIVAVALVVTVGLFAGGLVFMASGRSFEEFSAQ
jgi:hypothetical protein